MTGTYEIYTNSCLPSLSIAFRLNLVNQWKYTQKANHLSPIPNQIYYMFWPLFQPKPDCWFHQPQLDHLPIDDNKEERLGEFRMYASNAEVPTISSGTVPNTSATTAKIGNQDMHRAHARNISIVNMRTKAKVIVIWRWKSEWWTVIGFNFYSLPHVSLLRRGI